MIQKSFNGMFNRTLSPLRIFSNRFDDMFIGKKEKVVLENV